MDWLRMLATMMAIAVDVHAECVTQEEKNVADMIQTRVNKLASGDVWKQIQEGMYTVDSLAKDLSHHYVDLAFVRHSTAIQAFVAQFENADIKVPEMEWFKVAKNMVTSMVSAAEALPAPTGNDTEKTANLIKGGEVALNTLIKERGTFKRSLESMMKPTKTSAGDDFVKAAREFHRQLQDPAKTVQFINRFVDGVRTGYTDEKLMEAYHFVTIMIAKLPSFRRVFNEYYLGFSKVANPNSGIFLIKNCGVDAHGLMWPVSPRGTNACVVIEQILSINENCLDPNVFGTEYNVLIGIGRVDKTLGHFFHTHRWGYYKFPCSNLAIDQSTGYNSGHYVGVHTNAANARNSKQEWGIGWDTDYDQIHEDDRDYVASQLQDGDVQHFCEEFIPTDLPMMGVTWDDNLLCVECTEPESFLAASASKWIQGADAVGDVMKLGEKWKKCEHKMTPGLLSLFSLETCNNKEIDFQEVFRCLPDTSKPEEYKCATHASRIVVENMSGNGNDEPNAAHGSGIALALLINMFSALLGDVDMVGSWRVNDS